MIETIANLQERILDARDDLDRDEKFELNHKRIMEFLNSPEFKAKSQRVCSDAMKSSFGWLRNRK